jgi:hypothetical protein
MAEKGIFIISAVLRTAEMINIPFAAFSFAVLSPLPYPLPY